MSDEYEKKLADLAAYVDHEGGLDSLLVHGVTEDDIPDELKVRWYEMTNAWRQWVRLATPIMSEVWTAYAKFPGGTDE